ncbi:uncharacterized protein LOC126669868 isoform X2 [Mercurialis annua]|uniref:uncharacterized protein LOC126669868 isoform X2 n=1 Tax=Mercurialis annua TaxID=3986 RepID=UPI00215FD3B3|nr:uncharacterized protein LOC126669868 isoform X2 [Mercurialis annua]
MALSFSINAAILPQHHGKVSDRNSRCLNNVKNLLQKIKVSSTVSSPQESLQNGNWVKLICGASFEDAVDIRNLSLVYTLAGVDCIDCAADESIISAVNEGIEAARDIMDIRRPWIMISVNDDEDLHFRKAEFDPEDCPSDCSRPCENVCPADAISLEEVKSTAKFPYGTNMKSGVITERCYGCGRCFPVCPYDKIRAVTYVRDAAATAELLKRNDVDAIEIHTSGRQMAPFKELWDGLGTSLRYLKLVAVSLPYSGDSTVSSMNTMYLIMRHQLNCLNLWQFYSLIMHVACESKLDGRPMSGDIGRGATRESIAFAVRLAAAKDRPRGYFQLAGGTNAHTVDGLRKQGIFQTVSITDNKSAASPYNSRHALIGGIAYGGYARKIVGRVLRSMQCKDEVPRIEDHPVHLLEAVKEALNLVGTVKCYDFFSKES